MMYLPPGIQQKLTDFHTHFVPHPHYLSARERLNRIVMFPGNVRMLAMIGPSGVGKTTLIEELVKELSTNTAAAMQKDLAHVPFVRVSAELPDAVTFNFPDLYRRLLLAALEPAIDCKVDYRQYDELVKIRKMGAGSTTSGLRMAVEQCFRYRNIRLAIVDEAQHIAKTAYARRLADHMD